MLSQQTTHLVKQTRGQLCGFWQRNKIHSLRPSRNTRIRCFLNSRIFSLSGSYSNIHQPKIMSIAKGVLYWTTISGKRFPCRHPNSPGGHRASFSLGFHLPSKSGFLAPWKSRFVQTTISSEIRYLHTKWMLRQLWHSQILAHSVMARPAIVVKIRQVQPFNQWVGLGNPCWKWSWWISSFIVR